MKLRKKRPINSYKVDDDDNSCEINKNDSKFQAQSTNQVQRLIDNRSTHKNQTTRLAQILVNFINNINEDYQKLKTQKKGQSIMLNSYKTKTQAHPQTILKDNSVEFKQQQQKFQTIFTNPTASKTTSQVLQKKLLFNPKNKELAQFKRPDIKSISKNIYGKQQTLNIEKRSNNISEKFSKPNFPKQTQHPIQNIFNLTHNTINHNQTTSSLRQKNINSVGNFLPIKNQIGYPSTMNLTQLQQMMNNLQANFGGQNNYSYLAFMQNLSMMNYMLHNSLQKNSKQTLTPYNEHFQGIGIINPIPNRITLNDPAKSTQSYSPSLTGLKEDYKSKKQQTLHKRSCHHITIAYSTHLAKLKQLRKDLNSFKIEQLDPTYPAKMLKQKQRSNCGAVINKSKTKQT